MKKILIAGGAGYLGNKLAERLCKNMEVIIIDNFIIDTKQKREKNNALLQAGNIKIIEANIGDVNRYKKELTEIDVVVYMASLNSREQSNCFSVKYIQNNVVVLQAFLSFLKEYGNSLKKIILTSSRSVYGEGEYTCENCNKKSDIFIKNNIAFCSQCQNFVQALPNNESVSLKPTSIYGLSKKIQEDLVNFFSRNCGICLDIFRIYNVYGDDQEKYYNHIGVIPMLLRQIKDCGQVTLYGDGKIFRDYVYIDDVIDILSQSIESHEQAKRMIYNLGSGESVSLEIVCEYFKKYLKYPFNMILSKINDDILFSQADNILVRQYFEKSNFRKLEDYIKELSK